MQRSKSLNDNLAQAHRRHGEPAHLECKLAATFLLFTAGHGLAAQNGAVAVDALSAPPRQVAQDAAANELKLIDYDHSYLRYHVHTQDNKGDQIRDVIESKDGTVARVVYKGSRALTQQEDTDEHARLQGMIESPDAFHKHIEKDQTGKKLAVDLIKLLPDAMLFSYVPGQPQRSTRPGNAPAELVLDFQPNPKWSPPTMASEALTGIQGRFWVDARTHHLTRLEAEIFQGVNFGFGIFAHIYPGGQLMLEQVPVGDQRWMVSHFVEHVTVRAMMVKTYKENSDLQAYDFAEVPALEYRDAIKLLLSTPLPTGPVAQK